MRKRSVVPLVVLTLAVVGGIWAGVALTRDSSPTSSTAELITPVSAQVAQAEARRRVAGSQDRDVTLTAAPARIDLGDRVVSTWAFGGSVPGPTIRVNAGDVVRARVVNDLPADLTIHWHGIALRNDMDGVPDLTQQAIASGSSFTYEFTAPDPGTYFYHPHTGTQLDRGLYGALIVDDPEQRAAETDIPLILDDWIDGTGKDPDDVLAELEDGMGGMDMGDSEMDDMDMGDMDMGDSSASPLGADISDVEYPLYVLNGRAPTDPPVYPVRPGETVRLRLINAASATPFRVAFGSGRMTVIATDGFPVEPVDTDALLIGMGERYDVEVTVPRSGAFPLVAVAEGQDMQALAVLRAGEGRLPAGDVRPSQVDGELLTLDQLHATAAAALPVGSPDRTYDVDLTGNMMAFDWGIQASEQSGATLPVKAGERIRLVLANKTSMWHPIHLHGHTFQVVTDDGTGPRKDTVIIPPRSEVAVDLVADNPGQWVLHCHNIYHAEAGMMTTLNYLA
jgi:FtsP/CotA-like multicopper oxidase with cupredoxin domain